MSSQPYELTDEQYRYIVDMRGGCNCAYLGSVGGAPCNACTDEITLDELIECGAMEDQSQPVDEPVDYMKHVRDMCK